MNWSYIQPVSIIFGRGSLSQLKDLIKGYKRPVLICGPSFVKSSAAERIKAMLGEIAVFSGVSPNPDVTEVNRCSKIIREEKADIIVALGGGSTIDLAKAASLRLDNIEDCYKNGVPKEHLPLIALPTTAGSGSEVTDTSVLTDRRTGKKAPLNSPSLYPEIALIDPELTYTMPPYITACTGADALCHAAEGYWSKGHRPVCGALSVAAIKTILKYLPIAFKDGKNERAREKMAEASVMAGLAFNLPKTTAPHACSYPLTAVYNIPHGEACILTLDYFIELNKNDEMTKSLAFELGYASVTAFAEDIFRLKKELNLRVDLCDFSLTDNEVKALVKSSAHPNIKNNPVEITEDDLYDLYNKLRKPINSV